MNCLTYVRRVLGKIGVLRSFSDDESADAVTENLESDRSKTLEKLAETTQEFKEKSDQLVHRVERRKGDLGMILDNLKKISSSAEDASIMINQMMIHENREEGQ